MKDHDLVIRQATVDDAVELASLHNEIIREEYDTVYSPEALAAWASHDEARWRAIIAGDIHVIFVVVVDGHIIGAGGLNIAQQRLGVYVMPAWQEQGIGRKLMQKAFDMARSKGIVKLYLSAPAGAVPFYLKIGYVVVAERHHEFANGAVMPVFDMELSL